MSRKVPIEVFLEARLAERLQLASAAADVHGPEELPGDRWTYEPNPARIWDEYGRIVLAGGDYGGTFLDSARGEHIAMNSPGFVLVDVGAKRAIIAEVARWKHHYNDDDAWHSCSQAAAIWGDDQSPGSGCADDDRRGKPCDCGLEQRRNLILYALAAPFDTHPDFDPDWNTP